MKKKTVRVLLAVTLAMSMMAGCIGCGKAEEPKEDVKKEVTVKEESDEKLDDVKELLKYVPKADKVKIVKNAKDLDMDKILLDAVDEKLKSQVKEIQCDMKKVDLTKKGTYTASVMLLTLEEEESDEKLDDVKELLKYVPKADKLKVVENAKDLDMDKILLDAVDEKLKSQVKEIQCDMKKVDLTKKGTYTAPVMLLTLKESADSKDTAKAEDKNSADASKDKKDSKKVKDEKAKKPASEKTIIQTEIKIEVVSKEEVKELAEKGNLVIQADGKVAKAEAKEKDAEKKDADKKEESQKSETDTKDKATDTNTANGTDTGNTSTGGGNSNTSAPAPSTPDSNTGGGGYVPPAQEQPTPTPPPVNHTWAPEMAEQQVWVEEYITVLLCGCGAQFNDFASWNQHSIDGCDFGYSVTEIPSGGHYETQWVETGRYYCTSCGAYK